MRCILRAFIEWSSTCSLNVYSFQLLMRAGEKILNRQKNPNASLPLQHKDRPPSLLLSKHFQQSVGFDFKSIYGILYEMYM